MLTAREAADRLIVRLASEEQEGRSPYKCEDCGCAEFYVVYSSSDEVTTFEELACECSEEREYAARLKVLIRCNWVKFGRLEDDHRFFLDEYELKDTERENGDLDVACQHGIIEFAGARRGLSQENKKCPGERRNPCHGGLPIYPSPLLNQFITRR